MGLLWFGTPKKAHAGSPRAQSQRFHLFSSKSRPAFPSSNKSSSRGRREKSTARSVTSVTLSSGSDQEGSAPRNCPLPSADELEHVFKKFDANGDGKISSTELRDVMRSLGHDPSEEDLGLIVAEADTDGDGLVDLSEFVALNTEGVGNAESLRDLKDAFKIFDMDGNGSISAEELHNVLRRLGESCSLAECHNMIGKVDSDGNGQVSFDEFLAMMSAPNAS